MDTSDVNQLRNNELNTIEAIAKIKSECWDNCESSIKSKKFLYDGVQFHKIIGPWYEYLEIDEHTEWIKTSNKSLVNIKSKMEDELTIELVKWQDSFLNDKIAKLKGGNEL